MKVIENMQFGQERALYRLQNACLKNCRFAGEEDGESALKECNAIRVQDSLFDLRYPMWHVKGLEIFNSELTENCRAALWYDEDVAVVNSKLNGIKAFRECKKLRLENTAAASPEFCWRCRDIQVDGGKIESQYAFFESREIAIDHLTFSGKYSFQYTKHVQIARSQLDTKDAFWHAKHVTVTDSELIGEYLGWYSEDLTLIRCHIKGTQPLCYCKRLRLIDCTMEDTDLAFEYSDVNARVRGNILSVKNPRSGKIVADSIGTVIRTDDSVYPVRAKIVTSSQG